VQVGISAATSDPTLARARVGVAGAASFAITGMIDALFGGISAIGGLAIAWTAMPAAPSRRPAGARPHALLDCRHVLRNRRAMAWIVGYTVHTWELAALRAWGVIFLTVTAARLGAPAWLPTPTSLFTAAALVIVWNAVIYSDSSALTAGTVQAADPALRGATMGLHSMCGYAGGFVGPLGVGLALHLVGDDAMVDLAIVTLVGLFILRRLDRMPPGTVPGRLG
jgi:hypothetical protein